VIQFRRDPLKFVLAVGALAAVLSGCGVKGALEPPPRAQYSDQAATNEAAGARGASESIVTRGETSQVRNVGTPSVLPQIPPKEWTQSRDRQDEGPRRVERPDEPDEPFFLDGLL
jgi:predicted small lipoprotein YifL